MVKSGQDTPGVLIVTDGIWGFRGFNIVLSGSKICCFPMYQMPSKYFKNVIEFIKKKKKVCVSWREPFQSCYLQLCDFLWAVAPLSFSWEQCGIRNNSAIWSWPVRPAGSIYKEKYQYIQILMLLCAPHQSLNIPIVMGMVFPWLWTKKYNQKPKCLWYQQKEKWVFKTNGKVKALCLNLSSICFRGFEARGVTCNLPQSETHSKISLPGS